VLDSGLHEVNAFIHAGKVGGFPRDKRQENVQILMAAYPEKTIDEISNALQNVHHIL
jgi:hypothetical protein